MIAIQERTSDQRSILPAFDIAHVILRARRLHPSLTDEEFAEAEQLYREYWAAIKADPHLKMQPVSTLVDDIWHTHIYLSTRQYRADCEAYFGYYLNHEAICDIGGCSHDISAEDLNAALRMSNDLGEEEPIVAHTM